MSQLFVSSGKKKGYSEDLFTLQNLSPQKYGKAAYANLTYTPSRLADNVLYKDVSNQKKFQEGTSKLRETQTFNSIFQDRLSQLQEQKQGIEKTLGEQIVMYKKMLKQKQDKNEKRIKAMQQSFNNEIKALLNQKEEEAKFAQSQKQVLQNRIVQLEQIISDLRDQIDDFNNNHQGLRGKYENLEVQFNDLTKRFQQAQNNANKTQQRLKEQLERLKRHIYQAGIQFQSRLQKQIQSKDKEIQNLERLHRNELQKIQNKRSQQVLIKNQELKDLASTFEKQTNRLNGIIAKKEEHLAQMNKAIQAQKQKNFGSSKGYENEITALTHEKSRLKEELLKAQRKLQKLQVQHRQLQEKYSSIRNQTQSKTSQLQKDLQMNQIYYMQQMDKLQFALDQSTKQIIRLKVESQQSMAFKEQSTILAREIITMKELLLQSSDEMEKCKEEFLRICRQKDILAIRLRELGYENQTLYMIKNSRQQEAKGWRDSYFIQKKGTGRY